MEALQNLSEAPLTLCPECGKETLQKKVSAAGFQLKGTGWYETDFKDKKPIKKESAGSTESKAAPDSTSAASTDTSTPPPAVTESKETKKE
jgi:putative FmdB family regulatory protein